jgi:UDP-N-acetylglucosamine--N-acetylmuramyl-(pentapeptide) pyrophosphoryl-undecaprenol N-acetylglucosamine transferase
MSTAGIRVRAQSTDEAGAIGRPGVARSPVDGAAPRTRTDAPLALIMAGGTGGHVFPALALARELRQRSWQVVWLGTRRGLEARLVPAEHIPVEWLSVAGLRGKGAWVWVTAPLRLLRALGQALAAIHRRRPALVVGLGGFVAGPGGVAAWLMRKPLLIHEQNAVAGFTNRCLAHLARRVLTAFPGSFRARVHAEVVGNPVRREIAELPPPAHRFPLHNDAIRILVLGGSQGAARLNAIVPFALACAAPLKFDVRHQAGERWLHTVQQNYAQAGVSARLHAFIDDMAEAYGWADLVICRAGALTVSELAAAGVGAVLVPFPAATDDHQTRNAGALVDAGAAVMIPERQLSAEQLAGVLAGLCASREQLLSMAERARALARPRATQQLADACAELALQRRPGARPGPQGPQPGARP